MSLDELLALLPETATPVDRDLIERAYRLAEEAHAGQRRASGEAYFTHCEAVARILAELHLPPVAIAAGLLHDTVEDTPLEVDDLRREFGDRVADLVDAVTKLTSLPRVSRGDQVGAEADPEDDAAYPAPNKASLATASLRKTFLAMADDPLVVLIKLADRLHNMRTLSHIPNDAKRKRIARETMEIFAPLASRLGIWQIKWELEDLSFRYLDNEKYLEIARKLDERRSAREAQVQKICHHLEQVLKEAGMKDVIVTGRPKHIYSIYRKMLRKGVPFEEVHDVRGVRVIVPEKADCYMVLGIIHSHWRPIPGSFDDYIASPKENFYQSLHTAVVYDDGKTLEVQIRTHEMHRNAEYGIAAHWRYKEGGEADPDFERRIQYLRQLMEWRQEVEDAQEFVDNLKSEVFSDRVYVFTPQGDIIDLPQGATPIDFAYHIHTDVGHRCRGAKVGGKLVPLDYQLKTGDQVTILTAKRGGPSRDWLNPHLGMVKTQRARSKIRRWFKVLDREQNIKNGREMLERELRQLGLSNVNLEKLAARLNYKSVDDLCEALGCGDLPLTRVSSALIAIEQPEENEFEFPVTQPLETDSGAADGIQVRGLKGLLTRMARCCNPAPGDEIVGYITRGRGATIHRRDCPNILNIRDKERLVKVSWGEARRTFPVPVRIKAYDREGLMRDISTLLTDEGVSMSRVHVDVNRRNMATFDLVLEVRDIAHLSRILDRVERLDNVVDARRVRTT
ncbi:MAG: bifunctional (p)ppGpp synthetase/guanosine-3',5'-bis(diphosphate) 3'-pyrophosphohydrolase [Anaerolineae bacterium]|nr:MAG: bifunctional (p)ppGpp synthetase/guanosine-3',5'-bis(diphosphate) 3'-pyrophosphohydrolase [Anaerolineae bacterium]